jgi:hypothetical protein
VGIDMIASRGGLGIVLSLLLLPASSLRAQPRVPVAERALLNELPAGALPPENVEPLGEVLAREVGFMAKVGQLTPEETEELSLEARKTLRRWGARIDNAALAPSLRRELTPLLKDISRPAWQKYDAERERLETRRRHAAVLVQVAELDEAIVLTNEQRTMLCARLPKVAAANDLWDRRPSATPTPRLPVAISAGILPGCDIPDQLLATVLWPTQFAAYKQLKGHRAQQVTLVEQGGNPMVIGRQPALNEQLRQLRIYLDRLVDTADTECRLSDTQRNKLTLAGKIDIELFHERYLTVDAIADQDPIQKLARFAALGEVARATFSDPVSNYQRTLSARLTKDQQEKLCAAERERHAFRWQVLTEAVVVGFERSAAMTAAQCAELTQFLTLAVPAGRSATDWRIGCLKAIVDLPQDRLRSFFDDAQWSAAKRQLLELQAVARQLEAEAAGKVAVLRGIKIAVHRDGGENELEFEADEMRLEVP